MLGAWGLGSKPEIEPDMSDANSREAVRVWESVVGIWETSQGFIAGVVCADERVPWHPAMGQAFFQRHPDPRDRPTLYSYEQLQAAPDYDADLDLVVVRSDGEYVACTIGWFDDYNKLGTVEPLRRLAARSVHTATHGYRAAILPKDRI